MRLNDPQTRRGARRLLTLARGIGRIAEALTAEHFLEEVHYSGLGDDLLNRTNLNLFEPLKKWAEYPKDLHGLVVWRLRPKFVGSFADLDGLALQVARHGCAAETVAVLQIRRPLEVHFRFVLISKSHAHVGKLCFYGSAVRALLKGEEPQSQ